MQPCLGKTMVLTSIALADNTTFFVYTMLIHQTLLGGSP